VSGIKQPKKGVIHRYGNIEYAFAINHAFTEIKCFICKKWHNADSAGKPKDPGNTCVARAGRFKHIVVTVRKDDFGTKLYPTEAEVQLAIKAALKLP
jgi:hypothetical protein